MNENISPCGAGGHDFQVGETNLGAGGDFNERGEQGFADANIATKAPLVGGEGCESDEIAETVVTVASPRWW